LLMRVTRARSKADLEPTVEQRRVLLDTALGPIELCHHRAVDLFRGIPLVTGGLRWTDPCGTVHRLRSVIYGAGGTLERRETVALSEAVERYTGLTMKPDILATPRSALAELAIEPERVFDLALEAYERSG